MASSRNGSGAASRSSRPGSPRRVTGPTRTSPPWLRGSDRVTTMAQSTLQRLLDAGMQFGEVSRKQAEGVVRALVSAGEVQKRDAEKLVGGLVERGKDTSER